jgi:hypothetical protein
VSKKKIGERIEIREARLVRGARDQAIRRYSIFVFFEKNLNGGKLSQRGASTLPGGCVEKNQPIFVFFRLKRMGRDQEMWGSGKQGRKGFLIRSAIFEVGQVGIDPQKINSKQTSLGEGDIR